MVAEGAVVVFLVVVFVVGGLVVVLVVGALVAGFVVIRYGLPAND